MLDVLKENFSNAGGEVREGGIKYRYIYFVGNKSKVRQWKKELNYKIQDYPKGQNERYDTSYKPNIQVQLF